MLLPIGVDIPNQEEKQEPASTGEEDHFEDKNDNDPLMKWATWFPAIASTLSEFSLLIYYATPLWLSSLEHKLMMQVIHSSLFDAAGVGVFELTKLQNKRLMLSYLLQMLQVFIYKGDIRAFIES